MGQIKITVKDLGTSELLESKLKKLNSRGRLMRSAGQFAKRETLLNFARQMSYNDAPWAALSSSTQSRKGSSKILQDEGILKGGIALTSANQDQAIVQSTTGSEYGIYHMKGTSKMPARPYIGVGDRIRKGVGVIVNNWWEG